MEYEYSCVLVVTPYSVIERYQYFQSIYWPWYMKMDAEDW
jgi:hypothetical protein